MLYCNNINLKKVPEIEPLTYPDPKGIVNKESNQFINNPQQLFTTSEKSSKICSWVSLVFSKISDFFIN